MRENENHYDEQELSERRRQREEERESYDDYGRTDSHSGYTFRKEMARSTSDDPHAQSLHEDARRREAKRRTSRAGQINYRRRKKAMIERMILLGIIVLLIVIVIIAISSCGSDQETQEQTEQTEGNANGLSPDHESLKDLQLDVSAMARNYAAQNTLQESDVAWPPDLDADVKATLLEKSKGDQDVRWVLQNSSSYNVAGDDIHAKLFKLMAKEDAAIPFMTGFPGNYPNNTVNTCDETFTVGEVPYLYQWDPRWGYMEYSSAPFGTTGCGPTSFSMVAIAFSGNGTYSPGYVGQYSKDNGYMADTEGTYNSFFSDVASEFGFYATEEEPLTSEEILDALGQGALLICHMGPGDFTSVGHYIVAVSANTDGTVNIHDPYSKVNSEKSWDVSLLEDQASGFHICTKEKMETTDSDSDYEYDYDYDEEDYDYDYE